MLNRFVRPGDSIKRAVTAQQWNEFVKAADSHLLDTEATAEDSVLGSEQPYSWAFIVNQSTQLAGLQDIRTIATPSILPTEAEDNFASRMLFDGASPTVTDRGQFGLMTKSAEQNEMGRLAVNGVTACRLFVDADADWINRADVDPADATRLKATPEGSAQILWKDSGTDTEVDAIVRLGNPQHVSLPGKVKTSAVTAGGTGTVTVWQNGATTNYDIEGVKLDWMHNSESISATKQVLIGWFPDEALWRFTGAECE